MGRASTLATSVVALAGVVALTGCSGGGEATSVTTTATVAPETTTTTEPPLDAGEQVFVYTPEVGDCFDRRQLDEQAATRGQTEIVLLLDCSLPHANEIFAVVEYPNEAEVFPGEDPLQTFAKRHCPASFEAYVGRAYEVSELEIGYQFPTASIWRAGPQALGCYVFDPSGDKLVGSVAGSAR